MNRPGAVTSEKVRGLLERLTPQQRQYALLAALLVAGIGTLWLIFALADDGNEAERAGTQAAKPDTVTNLGVMAPGAQLDPADQWVGVAGRKLADYEQERDRQQRLNQERKAFETRTLERFAELEKRLTASPAPPPVETAAPPPAEALPPAQSLPPPPPPPSGTAGALPVGEPPLPPMPAAPQLQRLSLALPAGRSSGDEAATDDRRNVSTFLPVSFTRGTLLGGLDAPTGGQSQTNPHPVLIRLSNDSVLPNGFRGQYRECFVIAAGYGDISSERAYLRTESLSCVRDDGATLEAKIQGSVYGEDGKVGMRGRLVTKQGQMLANALLAGVVGGIGQGMATASADYSTSALGTVSNLSGSDAYRAGLGTGVGRALDRLAQYYIKLAENTFPVIEVDAGREIDVVITKGVRIDVPMQAATDIPRSTALAPAQRYLEVDDDY
ncbi:TraB/VirB10 family protein [Xanthomonas arboricola]|uniref:TraB/VirB10 family protein n=1 Tax=Xanthomonas arboricola TaxID=56448 RepID=UPI000CEF0046|nr:TraB/VirB10 family protein [Xanthomonas arboricola]PPT46457.1 conjugal transfer protein TraB [Xanthomonas arboricola]